MEEHWQGIWITGGGAKDDDALVPPSHFLRRWDLSGPVRRATVFVSALGCCAVTVNGSHISQDYFTPGYTQYTHRVQYWTYEVTHLLAGQTVCQVDAEVTGGWYAGRLGLSLKRNRYGDKRALLLELRLEYEDGTRETLATDGHWQYTTDGPRRFADFFDGEVYDARREDPARWHLTPVRPYSGPVSALEPASAPPVRRHERLSVVELPPGPEGEQIFQLPRNIAGIVELRGIAGTAGQEIVVRHAELLSNGALCRDNLRTAKASLTYLCRDGVQDYAPRFTYMGFQYCSVSGAHVTADQVCAWELYSDMEELGSFSCSNPLLNRLQENIVTSQKANFVDIPTDCPQRDERCGWTGDIAVFAPTAMFNLDAGAVLAKWCRDAGLCQQKGVIPMTVPDGGYGRFGLENGFGLMHHFDDAVWGDAIVLVPWAVYQATGDEQILRDNYQAMRDWLAYERRQSLKPLPFGRGKYIWSWGFHFGDWLAPEGSLLGNMGKAKWTSTAYFAHSARILSQVARILGREEDGAYYEDLFQKVRTAFRRAFLRKDGHFKKGFQSAWALALVFDLLAEPERRAAAADLNADVLAHGCHLTTGFAGTPALLFALSDNGYADTAWQLLLQETCPGWLYPVLCGATSVWERWDALKPDGTLNEDSVGGGNMVSFNHYAYGAVGEWLYRRVGGLEILQAGYAGVRIAPCPGGGVTWARCSHKTPQGLVSVSWTLEDQTFTLEVTLPEGVWGEVHMPSGTVHPIQGGAHTLQETISIPKENEQKHERQEEHR